MAAASPSLLELAQAALETLRVLRKHASACKQCVIDERWCDTYQRYSSNFELEYARWLEAR